MNPFFLLFSHKDEFTIVPVLVGALSETKEQEFGKLFSKYLADPCNLFVVSSDFCHWGKLNYISEHVHKTTRLKLTYFKITNLLQQNKAKHGVVH